MFQELGDVSFSGHSIIVCPRQQGIVHRLLIWHVEVIAGEEITHFIHPQHQELLVVGYIHNVFLQGLNNLCHKTIFLAILVKPLQPFDHTEFYYMIH